MGLVLRSLVLLSLACSACQSTTGTLIVLNKSDHNASLFELGSDTQLTLPTGDGPHEVAVSPDNSRAVVANYGFDSGIGFENGHTLTVFDLTEGRVSSTIDLGQNRRPHGVQFLADGRRLAVTVEAEQALLVVDVDEGKIIQRISTDATASHMVVVAPDQPRAFVANISEGSLTVIDLDKGELIKTIPTGAGCEGLDITPDGKQVWTTNRAANTLSVVDAHSLEVIAEISCGDFPIRLKFTPDGQRAVISCAVSGDVVVVDVITHAELARVPLTLHIVDDAGERLFGEAMAQTPAPVGVLIDPTGTRAYIAATNADRVVVLDLETYELVGSLVTGSQPDGLGWAPVSKAR